VEALVSRERTIITTENDAIAAVARRIDHQRKLLQF
jgi:hypothetical protein